MGNEYRAPPVVILSDDGKAKPNKKAQFTAVNEYYEFGFNAARTR